MKRIGPGFYIDEAKNELHVYCPEMLRHLNVKDTPENREQCMQIAARLLREKWPSATTTFVREE